MSGALIETQSRKIRDESEKKGGDNRDKERIADMLSRGKTPQEIADFCDYPLELVLKVKESMMVAV